jgi:hypothetical protein
MKIIEHLEFLEGLITEDEKRAGRGKSIAADIRDYAKQKARETLRRCLIDGDSKRHFYSPTNYMALSDKVWHLLECYFRACYEKIDFPKPSRPRRFVELDHLRQAREVRWLEQPESAQEEPLFQHPPFTLRDIDLAAANLGFKLANGKDMFPPLSDSAAEMLLAEADYPVYQFHWELK